MIIYLFEIKVEINISDDIISNLDNAKKYLNNIHSVLHDNISDKKCQNAYRQLSDILHDFNKLENVIKEIKIYNNIQ